MSVEAAADSLEPHDFADGAFCAMLAQLESQAAEHDYLLTVWPHTEPHTGSIEVDHEAACIHLFEPAAPKRTTDAATVRVLSRLSADIEAEAARTP